MKKLLALLAVLGLVNVASAAVTYEVLKNPDTGGYLPAVEGYDNYLFSIFVTGDNCVRAFDVEIDTNGVAGILQQVVVTSSRPLTYGVISTFNGVAPVGATTTAFTSAQISQMAAGECSQSVVNEAEGFEDASYVRYAYGIQDSTAFPSGFVAAGNNDLKDYPARTGVYSVVNLYLKQGVAADVYFGAAAGSAGEGIFFEDRFVIPEPATIGLLAMGFVGLLRRKYA